MRLKLILALIAILGSAQAALAEDWIFTAGVRGRVSPTFEGSSLQTFQPLPIISLRRADRPYRFTPPSVGATFDLISTGPLVIGPVVRIRHSRDDMGRYAGLAPISKALLPGAFVEYWPRDWLRARVEARRAFTGDGAWNGDAGLDLIHTGMRWDASIGPRIGYGDASYMQSYFGVTPGQAAVGPLYRTAYVPGAGVRYTGATAAVSWHATEHWRLGADVSYQRLASKALASPVLRIAGTPDQLAVGISVSYQFGMYHFGG